MSVVCADYRDVLHEISDDCVIVTDPPYGIGFDYGNGYADSDADYKELMQPLAGKNAAILQYPEEMMRLLVPIFGPPDEVLAWVYPSNLKRQFRLWGLWGVAANFSNYKQKARNPESAKVKSAMVDSYDWWEQPQVKNVSSEKTSHPCQIPVTSVERVIALINPKKVFDPFSGSGTTGVACARLGVDFIGAEIDEGFCAIANERITTEKAQGTLFDGSI